MGHRSLLAAGAFALATLPLSPSVSTAQIAVSANDNKLINVGGRNQVVENPAPDTATIVDLGVSPPKVIGEVKAGAAVAGVPQKRCGRT